MISLWEKVYIKRGLSGLEDNRGGSKEDMRKANNKSKINTPIYESEREQFEIMMS